MAAASAFSPFIPSLPFSIEFRAPMLQAGRAASLNTAGRPMVDDPRDALELFGSAPVDLLVLGPYVVRRPLR